MVLNRLPALLIAFCLSCGFAQTNAATPSTYFGVSLDLFTDFANYAFAPIPSFQVGAEVSEGLELRASLGTVLIISLLQVDVLYTTAIPDSEARFYIGGGPDLLFSTFYGGGALFGLHGTLGAAYPLSKAVDTFGEIQPILSAGIFVARIRVGLNFYI